MFGLHPLSIAQSPSAPNVPMWLQILTLALAPALGFAGVAVGASLQGRSGRTAKLRDDRRTTYLTFANDVQDFYHWFGLEGIKSAAHRPGVDLKQHLGEMTKYIGRIQTHSYEVDLIASNRAALACAVCVKEVLVCQMIWIEAIASDSFDRVVWSRCYHDGSAALREFRDAAMRDLGLSRRDRRRPETAVPDTAKIEETHDFARRLLAGIEPDTSEADDLKNDASSDGSPGDEPK